MHPQHRGRAPRGKDTQQPTMGDDQPLWSIDEAPDPTWTCPFCQVTIKARVGGNAPETHVSAAPRPLLPAAAA